MNRVFAFNYPLGVMKRSMFLGGFVISIAWILMASGVARGQGLAPLDLPDAAVGIGGMVVQNDAGIWPGASVAIALKKVVSVEGMLHRTSSNHDWNSLMGRRTVIRVSGDVVRQSNRIPVTLGFSMSLAHAQYERKVPDNDAYYRSLQSESTGLSGRIHRRVFTNDTFTLQVFAESEVRFRLVRHIQGSGHRVHEHRQSIRILSLGGTASLPIGDQRHLIVRPAVNVRDPDISFIVRTGIFLGI